MSFRDFGTAGQRGDEVTKNDTKLGSIQLFTAALEVVSLRSCFLVSFHNTHDAAFSD